MMALFLTRTWINGIFAHVLKKSPKHWENEIGKISYPLIYESEVTWTNDHKLTNWHFWKVNGKILNDERPPCTNGMVQFTRRNHEDFQAPLSWQHWPTAPCCHWSSSMASCRQTEREGSLDSGWASATSWPPSRNRLPQFAARRVCDRRLHAWSAGDRSSAARAAAPTWTRGWCGHMLLERPDETTVPVLTVQHRTGHTVDVSQWQANCKQHYLLLFIKAGRSGLVVTRMPAAREGPGSNCSADKSLCFHENHFDMQLWAWAAHRLQCLGWLSLPPPRDGKWVSNLMVK